MQVFTSTIWQTTSTLIYGNKDVFLFDPGYLPFEIAKIQQSVGCTDNKTAHLIFTHGDWDHIAGFSSFQNWSTIGSEQILIRSDIEKTKELGKIIHFDRDLYIERRDKPLYPRIDKSITQLTEWKTDDDLILFVPVKGHTNDGIATFFTERGLVVAGDILSNLEFPFIYDSTRAYLSTLEQIREKVETYNIRMLIPGHGRIATTQAEIKERIQVDLDYLQMLFQKVETLVNQGFRDKELIETLSNFRYKQQQIKPHLIARHIDNIIFMKNELTN